MAEFNGYHIIECACTEGAQDSLSFEKIDHNFGSGYYATEMNGSDTGLRTFSIPYSSLTTWQLDNDIANERHVFRGRSYDRANYIRNIFAWQMRTGQPLAVRSPLTNQIYLVRFAEASDSLTKKLNAVFEAQIKLVQVRLKTDSIYDVSSLSNVYAHLDANYFAVSQGKEDNDPIDSVLWYDYTGKGHHFGTVNGNNVYHTDEFKGLSAVKFEGNASASYFQRTDDVTIYEVFALMKFDGTDFDQIQGIVSGENGGQVLLATNSTGTNFFDLDGDADTYEAELNGTQYPNSAFPAPFGEYKVVRVRYENGIALTKIQIGKDRDYTNRYGEFYLQTIILCDGLVTEVESRELTEYLLSDRKPYVPIDFTSPPIPVMASASNITASSIRWNWNASVGAVAYDLEIATDVGFTTGLRTINLGNVLLYNDTGLNPEETYYARVRARDADGNASVYSDSVNATTLSVVVNYLLAGVSESPLAVYSLRKTRSGYSGSLIRVINTTTSVQTDIPANAGGDLDRMFANTLFTTGQTLEIVKFYDQSGNGKDATAVTTRAILDLSGHRPAAYCNQANGDSIQYLTSATFDLTAPKFLSVIDVYNYDQMAIVDWGTGNQFQTRIAGKQVYLNNGSAVTFNPTISEGAIASDGIVQITHGFVSGNDFARKNGVDLTLASGTNAGDTARSAVTLSLLNFANSGLGFTGKFYEMPIFDGSLSNSSRNAMEANQLDYFQNGKRIVVFGDSIAYGTGTEVETGGVYENSFGAKLKKTLPDGWDVMNRGSAGDSVQNMLSTRYAAEIVPLYRPDAIENVLILNGGYNDAVALSRTASQIVADLNALADLARSDGWDRILYRTHKIQNVQPSYQTILNQIDSLIVADPSHFDDLVDSRSDAFIGALAPGDPTNTTYFNDGLHLTGAGYIREASYATI